MNEGKTENMSLTEAETTEFFVFKNPNSTIVGWVKDPILIQNSAVKINNSLCIHPKGTYFVAPAVKIFARLDLDQNITF